MRRARENARHPRRIGADHKRASLGGTPMLRRRTHAQIHRSHCRPDGRLAKSEMMRRVSRQTVKEGRPRAAATYHGDAKLLRDESGLGNISNDLFCAYHSSGASDGVKPRVVRRKPGTNEQDLLLDRSTPGPSSRGSATPPRNAARATGSCGAMRNGWPARFTMLGGRKFRPHPARRGVCHYVAVSAFSRCEALEPQAWTDC